MRFARSWRGFGGQFNDDARSATARSSRSDQESWGLARGPVFTSGSKARPNLPWSARLLSGGGCLLWKRNAGSLRDCCSAPAFSRRPSQSYFDNHPTSPFVEELSVDFLHSLRAHPDPLLRAVSQSERALLQCKAGSDDAVEILGPSSRSCISSPRGWQRASTCRGGGHLSSKNRQRAARHGRLHPRNSPSIAVRSTFRILGRAM